MFITAIDFNLSLSESKLLIMAQYYHSVEFDYKVS